MNSISCLIFFLHNSFERFQGCQSLVPKCQSCIHCKCLQGTAYSMVRVYTCLTCVHLITVHTVHTVYTILWSTSYEIWFVLPISAYFVIIPGKQTLVCNCIVGLCARVHGAH